MIITGNLNPSRLRLRAARAATMSRVRVTVTGVPPRLPRIVPLAGAGPDSGCRLPDGAGIILVLLSDGTNNRRYTAAAPVANQGISAGPARPGPGPGPGRRVP